MTKTYGNDTFGALSDKCLSKIKVSNAKRQDGLQLNLELVRSKVYLHNGFYLRYTSSYCIAKNLKRNPLTQKCASAEESVAKRRRSALLPFSFTESCLFCGEMCSLRPHPRNPSRWKRSILSRTVDHGEGNKKFQRYHTAGMCSCTSDDGNLSLLLPGLQNLGFEKSTKNSCDI